MFHVGLFKVIIFSRECNDILVRTRVRLYSRQFGHDSNSIGEVSRHKPHSLGGTLPASTVESLNNRGL